VVPHQLAGPAPDYPHTQDQETLCNNASASGTTTHGKAR
jgi:hypothetical protein